MPNSCTGACPHLHHNCGNCKAIRAFLALLLAAPFFVYEHTPPLANFYTEWAAAALACVYCALGLVLVRATSLEKFPRVALPPLLLALMILFQIAAGMVIYLGLAMVATLALLLATLTIWVVANHRLASPGDPLVDLLATTLVITGVLCVLISLIQLLRLETPFNAFISWADDYYHANIGQRNHYGSLMALALAATIYRITRSPRWFLVLALPALAFGLSLSSSRSVWLYLLVIAAASFRLPAELRSAKRLIVTSLAAIAVLVVAFDRLIRVFVPSFVDALGRMGALTGGGNIRLEMWRDALAGIVQQPLFGVGFQGGSYWHFVAQSLENNPVSSPKFDLLYLENYHNLILHLGVEFRLPGLLIGAALAVYTLLVFWRVRTLADWLLASLLGVMFIHSMLEYPLHHMNYLLIFSVVLGLTEWRYIEVKFRDSLRQVSAAVVLFLGGFLLYSLFTAYRAIEAVEIARMQGRLQLTAQVRSLLKDAAKGDFLSPYVDATICQVDPEDFDVKVHDSVLAASERTMRFRTSLKTVEAHIGKSLRLFFRPP